MTSVIPSVSLTLTWSPPSDTGCLPLTSYLVNKNGVDLPAIISPGQNTYTDSIVSGGSIGTQITYQLKAINAAGASPYTSGLVVTVGQAPNAPTGLTISQQYSATSLEMTWLAETTVSGNLPTTAYRVYLDDLSGNGKYVAFDSS
jgi:hypothetical protein